MTTNPLQGVKALLFDVFGTVVDWQGSIHRQLVQHVQSNELGTLSSCFALPRFTLRHRPFSVHSRRLIALEGIAVFADDMLLV